MIQLFFLGIIAIVIQSRNNADARLSVKYFSNKHDLRLTINGISPDSIRTKELLTALQNILESQAHHSSPTDTVFIQLISKKDTMVLFLRQDSQYPTGIC